MIPLTEKEIRNLKIGEDVLYRERSGQLSTILLRARVIEKHGNFITLRCAANADIRDTYDKAKNYFNTSFCYNDGIEYGGYRLYKESLDDILERYYAPNSDK